MILQVGAFSAVHCQGTVRFDAYSNSSGKASSSAPSLSKPSKPSPSKPSSKSSPSKPSSSKPTGGSGGIEEVGGDGDPLPGGGHVGDPSNADDSMTHPSGNTGTADHDGIDFS